MKRINKRKILFWLNVSYIIANEWILFMIGIIFNNIAMFFAFYLPLVYNDILIPFVVFESLVVVSFAIFYELIIKKYIPSEYFKLKPHIKELMRFIRNRNEIRTGLCCITILRRFCLYKYKNH